MVARGGRCRGAPAPVREMEGGLVAEKEDGGQYGLSQNKSGQFGVISWWRNLASHGWRIWRHMGGERDVSSGIEGTKLLSDGNKIV